MDLTDDRHVVVHAFGLAVLAQATVLHRRDSHHGVEVSVRKPRLNEIAVDEAEIGMSVGIWSQIDTGNAIPQAGQVKRKRRLRTAEVENPSACDGRQVLQDEWNLDHALDDDQIVVPGHRAVEQSDDTVARRAATLEVDRHGERRWHHAREHPKDRLLDGVSDAAEHQHLGDSWPRESRQTRAAAKIQKTAVTFE